MDVKSLREKLDLTQSQLADSCGVSIRTIQNWEAGTKIPAAMIKLLQNIDECNEKISSLKNEEKQSLENTGEKFNMPLHSQEFACFFSTIERQQDIMSRQLDEIIEMRRLSQKKDEQIDTLLKMIQSKI